MGYAVLHQAAMDAVGSAGGTAADIGCVDVEDVQRLAAKELSSLLGI